MREIRAFIFDLDGVLVSTDEYHYLAWSQLAREENIYFDRKINDRLRGVSRMDSLRILLERASCSYTPQQQIRMAEYKNQLYRDSLQQLSPADLLPGALALLHQLKERGYRIAVGSSSRNTPLILRQCGIETLFDAVADGNQITRSKPDPEVFTLAARLLGVPAEECVVFEDAHPGVEAAVAAGALAVAVGAAQGDPRAVCSVEGLDRFDLDAFLSGKAQ